MKCWNGVGINGAMAVDERGGGYYSSCPLSWQSEIGPEVFFRSSKE